MRSEIMGNLFKVGDEVKVCCPGSTFHNVTGRLVEKRASQSPSVFWCVERDDEHGPFVFEDKYLVPRDWSEEEALGADMELGRGSDLDSRY